MARFLTAKTDDALSEIFGTDQTEQINGLLSQCLKTLKADEADEKSPAPTNAALS